MARPTPGNRGGESSTTIGTGAYALNGAIPSYQTLVAACGSGQTIHYHAVDNAGGSDFEVGEGVVTAGSPDTLTRVTIFASSNGGAAVNWAAGTRNIVTGFTAQGFLSLLAGRKNVVINGNFGVNQRAVSGTVVLAAGEYGHDRFKGGASGCTYTFATSANVTTLTISAGSLQQVIGGSNLFTDTYTLSWAGTAQGKIGAGSYASSGVTGSVTGGTNLTVEFNTGTLSFVQLEKGSVATDFERRTYAEELDLCTYYFSKSTTNSTYSCVRSVSAARMQGVTFPKRMRTTPTVTLYSPNGTAGKVATLATPSTDVGTSIVAELIDADGYSRTSADGALVSGEVYIFGIEVDAEL